MLNLYPLRKKLILVKILLITSFVLHKKKSHSSWGSNARFFKIHNSVLSRDIKVYVKLVQSWSLQISCLDLEIIEEINDHSLISHLRVEFMHKVTALFKPFFFGLLNIAAQMSARILPEQMNSLVIH